ncbi:hypothetical protein [Gordonia paraffinivorans]|uniref:hypothetical protein n=1 Tax=Gordonia paraffinivorans TaxID=175628 RepID=UPI001E407B04|nr:hypothetical protein [Gordonia paraffinivorans]MCD2143960.1 hypothetical protein [Gordonia paraffinivorans]
MADTKHLEDLIAEAQARVRKLREKQREQERREALKLGKRVQAGAAKGREALTAELLAIRDELCPEDGEPEAGDAPQGADSSPGSVAAATPYGGGQYGH